MGKTRLAQEVATAVESSVAVVELASVRSADDVALALASTLGITELQTSRRMGERLAPADLQSRIVSLLGDQPTLLVLDNCEHLIDAAADWTALLLATAPGLRVLTTSRAPLALAAEVVYPLRALTESSLPHDHGRLSAAAELFEARARAARPDVRLDPAEVEELCRRLDGLPLAIELAAARARSMSVTEIATRLEDRFALLTTGDRSAPERHRTLLNVIEWSWELLDTRAQDALLGLCRFVDGFDLRGAAAALGVGELEAATVVDALAAQTLVSVRESDGAIRYRMLETVREFGELVVEQRGTGDLLTASMSRWAREFSQSAARGIGSPDQVAAIDAGRREQENLLAVLRDTMTSEDGATAVAIFAVVGYVWTVRSLHSEVLGISDRVLRATRRLDPPDELVDAAAHSYAIIGITNLLARRSRIAAVALSRLRRLRATRTILDVRVHDLARLLGSVLDLEGGMRIVDDLCASPDPRRACFGLLLRSQLSENAGESEVAAESARRAWELAERVGDVWVKGSAALSAAQLASQNAAPGEALLWLDRAQATLSALDADGDLRQLDWLRGLNLIETDDYDEARAIFERFQDDDRLGEYETDLASIRWAGSAEIELAAGDVDLGLELYRRCIDSFAGPAERASPWYMMALAGCVSAHVLHGRAGERLLRGLVIRLVSRTLALHRIPSAYSDKPVLGSAAVGTAAWLLGTATSDADESWATGQELLALGAALGSRQDQPSLHRDTVDGFADARFPGTTSSAGAEAAPTPAEAASRTYELLARVLHHALRM